ncbi:ectoine/hydroxyectoine ABC transporter substrate-binding protein EhuB [Paracoccus aestuariivivens]|uniref:Ectoine/hydroxyectoine ABC transporter substrate-binding protein EhuB n=1 Tax=Paracoccus aestuariivivens TaxID=1820333 RepID=A0A6L6JAC2_9RHOB|nr:ectoine/hydroxyectoine ABC transporter substrate-binding protein EhuB [Paracoccus aestuariivivens]MTH79133.1 ectoine/hydroxyectoine ABC transporter substrate-binding protein EhuB [Paracoccus aestuariivivens]
MIKHTYLFALALAGMTGTLNAADLAEIKESGTLRVAVANEIPYGYMDMNGKAAGAGPEVAKLVAAKLGVKQIEWITTNFSSLIPGLQADRFDMVAAEMAILPDRCKQVLFSEPNTSYGEGLLVAAGNPKEIHAYGDFAKNKDLKVAIMSGADQLEMMQALGVPEGNIVMIASNADAISTVSTGRADAYAATGLTASGLAGQSDKVEIAGKFTDPMIDGEEVRSWGGFAFASGNEELRDAVNEALAEVKKSPEWTETVTGYGFTQADVEGSTAHTAAELCGA